MAVVSETTLKSITIDSDCLENWDGVEYVFCGLKGTYTSDTLTYSVELKRMDSDGLSIPRELRDRIERLGRRLVAGLHHDLLYAGEIFPRKLADWVFLEILEYKDLNDRTKNPHVAPSRLWGWVLRNGAWLAVKAGGGFVWKKHKKEQVIAFRKLVKIKIKEADPKVRCQIKEQEAAMVKSSYPAVIVWAC